MLTVVHDAESSNDDAGAGRSLLDEIVRDGARRMLEAALQAEVAAYVEQFIDQVDDNGRRLVVRNGYHQQRDVLTAAGAVAVKAPRVNDKRVDPDSGERQRFSSAILPAWARKSPQMTEVLPLLARCFGRVVNGVGGDPAHRCQVGPLAPRTARGHGSTQLSRQWFGAADAA